MSSKYNQGFTLPELLITIVITVIVVGVGFLNLFNYKESQNLKLSFQEVMTVIRDTQKKAITQDGGSGWGIRFINSPTIGQRYEIFSGSSYTPSAVKKFYNLGRSASFGEPSSSSTYDLIFSAINGSLSQNKIISLISRPNGSVADIIVNKSGLSTGRFENNVQGYWHYDEGTSTTVYDTSGFNRNGNLISGPTWQFSSNCKSGGCLNFDGVDDYASTTQTILDPGSTDFTIETWVKWAGVNTGTYQVIVQQGISGKSWLLRRTADGALCLGFGILSAVPTCSSSQFINSSQWYHLALTKTGTNSFRLYLQGVEAGPFTKTVIGSNGGIRMGAYSNLSDPTYTQWPGIIDEARIYNRVLSAPEILNHYNDLK